MTRRVHRSGYRLATLVVVALVGLAAASGGAIAHGGDDGAHHHDGSFGMHDGGWWGWMGLGWLWLLVPLTVLVVVPSLAVLAFRSDGDGGGDAALQRLRERYAAGELDDEEFERRRERLSEG